MTSPFILRIAIPYILPKANTHPQSIILIDPCDPIVERAEIIKDAGESALNLFNDGYIKFGNEHLAGRKTPSSEVMVVKPSWKNT